MKLEQKSFYYVIFGLKFVVHVATTEGCEGKNDVKMKFVSKLQNEQQILVQK